MFSGKLLLYLPNPVFNKIFDHCLIPYFPLKLFINFSFCVSNDPLHHLILLLHFSVLEALNLPNLILLAIQSLLPLHPLFRNKLPNLLLLPKQLKTELLDLRILMFNKIPLCLLILK